MADPARISVALAAYNGARYLEPQLESLARQIRPPWEVVAFDDGSSDGTAALLARFADRAPFPVRLRRNRRRRGYRANFVQAAAACGGDLIAFCDQDDVWEPDKLARMAEPFADPEVQLAYHDATLIDATGRPVGRLSPSARGPWAVVPGFTQVFRRRLADFSRLHDRSVDYRGPVAEGRDPPPQTGHPVNVLAHDQFFVFWALALGKAVHVPMALARYRQHSGGLFGRPPGLWGRMLFELADAPDLAAGRAEAIVAQITLLEAAEPICSPDETVRLQDFLLRLRAALPSLRERAALYRTPGAGRRSAALARLVLAGGYAGGAWGAPGLAHLLVDLSAALPHSLRYKKDRGSGLLHA